MFKENNRENFYPEISKTNLSKTEILFFGLLASGAVKLESVPMPDASDECAFIDTDNKKVMTPLTNDLYLLADLYEQCRRFVGRREANGRALSERRHS